MVNSCRSGFDFDMRINRYLSPLLWWKSAFEDTFQPNHRRVRRSKEYILIVSGMIDSGKENFSLKETVRERGESRCTQALRKADFLRRSAMVRYSTLSHNQKAVENSGRIPFLGRNVPTIFPRYSAIGCDMFWQRGARLDCWLNQGSRSPALHDLDCSPHDCSTTRARLLIVEEFLFWCRLIDPMCSQGRFKALLGRLRSFACQLPSPGLKIPRGRRK